MGHILLFPAMNFKFSKDKLKFNKDLLKLGKGKLRKLIDDLAKVDLKLADPVKRPVFSRVLGESKAHKNKKAEVTKALLNKKCMLINAFELPEESKELMAFSHLAFSCYRAETEKSVKETWYNKLQLSLHKLRGLINADQGEDIADEYLFLTEEVKQLKEKN